ncbi:DUF1269 domain-containing protein [Kitasatospora sp. NPDC059146]|uniref:DUF1269 domain-containing protein n=1 Tax=Kitasatospora sp. NPDC059146 TaxID=3346741 RepID=UPI0036B1BCEA
MSELIIIGYDDSGQANKAYQQVQKLQADYVVNLVGLALVHADEKGETHVDTPARFVGASAASGALWGTVFGLLFLVPGLGLLIGGAMGGLIGKLGKTGINDQFRARVHDLLAPGKSAVVIMATKVTEDKFAVAMQPYGGTILKTSLSEDDEREIAEHLTAPGSAG